VLRTKHFASNNVFLMCRAFCFKYSETKWEARGFLRTRSDIQCSELIRYHKNIGSRIRAGIPNPNGVYFRKLWSFICVVKYIELEFLIKVVHNKNIDRNIKFYVLCIIEISRYQRSAKSQDHVYKIKLTSHERSLPLTWTVTYP